MNKNEFKSLRVLEPRVKFYNQDALIKISEKGKINEVIIATSATVEGMTTAYYIKDSLKGINVKVSKLAQGLPVGGEIENLDDGTLFSAFKNRNGVSNKAD